MYMTEVVVSAKEPYMGVVPATVPRVPNTVITPPFWTIQLPVAVPFEFEPAAIVATNWILPAAFISAALVP